MGWQQDGRHGKQAKLLFSTASGLILLAATGCANPGPPRPPSLFLPEAATKVTALREGDTVTVTFTVPEKATDSVPLKRAVRIGSLCRQLEHGPCTPVASLPARITVPAKDANGKPNVVTWRDALPAGLTTGAPRLIAYRITFYSPADKPGELSDPVYTVAGEAPPALFAVSVQGSRRGPVISWADEWTSPITDATTSIAVCRTEINPKSTKVSRTSNSGEPGVTWLTPATTGHLMVDDTAELNTRYTYAVQRRQTITIGGRSLELRSDLTKPITIDVVDIYPPAFPTGLHAAAFATEATATTPASYAVDLIWQPVNDARLAGYNVYRQPLDASGNPTGPQRKLTATPVALPAYHDTTATAATRYRYDVTAIDPKGNESRHTVTTLEP